jgi:hypothetical protein
VTRSTRPRQALEVDLESGEEQQEGQPDQRQDRDRQVHLDPSQSRGPDHDAQHDLQHDSGKPQAREEAQRERSGKGHRHHDQQVGEVDLGHAGC